MGYLEVCQVGNGVNLCAMGGWPEVSQFSSSFPSNLVAFLGVASPILGMQVMGSFPSLAAPWRTECPHSREALLVSSRWIELMCFQPILGFKSLHSKGC